VNLIWVMPAEGNVSRIGIIITGGDPPSPGLAAALPTDPLVVVAADSGFDHAVALGLAVDVVVGDLDSISPGGLALASSSPTIEIEQHRPDKDATDTELAIHLAVERGAEHLVGVGGGGDRLDHQLGTLAAFAAAAHRGITVELWWRDEHVDIIDGPATWQLADTLRFDAGQADESRVSLIPLGGPVSGVTTQHLQYPLNDATLSPKSAIGVSNVALDRRASVSCTAGTLAIITPGVVA
jgi:thiamine pyrophosphokinase